MKKLILRKTNDGQISIPLKDYSSDEIISSLSNQIYGLFNGLDKNNYEINRIMFNHRLGSAQVDVKLNVRELERKGNDYITIRNANTSVLSMISSDFKEYSHFWRVQENQNILSIRDVVSESDEFLLRVEGYVDKSIINDLIYYRMATDPSDDNGKDRYWIFSIIKDPEVLKGLTENFLIEQVNTQIAVLIRRCFSTSLPHQLKIVLQARSDLLKAVQSGDRGWKRKAEFRLKKVEQLSFDEKDILKTIGELIAEKLFSEYLSITNPYHIGEISPEDSIGTPIPNNINVNLFTKLNAKNDAASGNLYFKREEYKEKIKELIKGDK